MDRELRGLGVAWGAAGGGGDGGSGAAGGRCSWCPPPCGTHPLPPVRWLRELRGLGAGAGPGGGGGSGGAGGPPRCADDRDGVLHHLTLAQALLVGGAAGNRAGESCTTSACRSRQRGGPVAGERGGGGGQRPRRCWWCPSLVGLIRLPLGPAPQGVQLGAIAPGELRGPRRRWPRRGGWGGWGWPRRCWSAGREAIATAGPQSAVHGGGRHPRRGPVAKGGLGGLPWCAGDGRARAAIAPGRTAPPAGQRSSGDGGGGLGGAAGGSVGRGAIAWADCCCWDWSLPSCGPPPMSAAAQRF